MWDFCSVKNSALFHKLRISVIEFNNFDFHFHYDRFITSDILTYFVYISVFSSKVDMDYYISYFL